MLQVYCLCLPAAISLKFLSACSVFDTHLPSPVTAWTSACLRLGFALRALSLALSFLPALHFCLGLSRVGLEPGAVSVLSCLLMRGR